MILNGLETNAFEKLRSRASFWSIIRLLAKKIEIWPWLVFVTSTDLVWPRDFLFWKACVKSVILIYNLPYFINVQNLTYFWDFWPRMTSGDLATAFFGKLTSWASFWDINSLPYEKFEIWPKMTRNLKFDTRPEIFYSIFSFCLTDHFEL